MNQDILFIQNLVSEEFGVSLEDLIGKSHKSELIPARHCAMYWCKKYTNESMETIAIKYFHKRDHTSLIHAIKRYDQLLYDERQEVCDWIEMLLIERFGEVNYLPKKEVSERYTNKRRRIFNKIMLRNKAA